MDEKNTFVLCFVTILWKRIWNSVLIYSRVKSVPITVNLILNCLKYNLLCPHGLAYEIKPFLLKALKNGFLMPKEFKENTYAKNAIELFSDAYKNKNSTLNFIISRIEEDSDEQRDALKGMEEIEFCNLVDIWNIELGLLTEDEAFTTFLGYHLLKFLKE